MFTFILFLFLQPRIYSFEQTESRVIHINMKFDSLNAISCKNDRIPKNVYKDLLYRIQVINSDWEDIYFYYGIKSGLFQEDINDLNEKIDQLYKKIISLKINNKTPSRRIKKKIKKYYSFGT